MSKVNNIVFDIGRVLLDFNHDRFFTNLEQHGAIYSDKTLSTVEELKLLEFEHGYISDEEFISMVNKKLTKKLPSEIIAQCWHNIFDPVPEMLNLAKELKKTKNVFLLSNTNNLHWQHMIDKYDFDSLAHGRLASCEVGSMKPDPKIYKSAEERFNLIPAETVFIDDIERNAKGAVEVGWKAIHHRNFNQTFEILNQLI